MTDGISSARPQKNSWHISRAIQIETVLSGTLLLLALTSGFVMWVISEINAEADHKTEQRLKAKAEIVRKELDRRPGKTKDEKLAEECERLATDRLYATEGGRNMSEFYLWRKSIQTQYDGIKTFVENFDRAAAPLPDYPQRVIETSERREKLYRRYYQAKRNAEASYGQPTERDEFETAAEHKARLSQGEQAKMALEGKRDEVLDEIVDLERTCSPDLIRSSLNGFYILDEALIFVPYADWSFEAEEHRFRVIGRSVKEKYKELFNSDDKETIQSFNFTLNGIRVSQFVKSRMVNCSYKPDGGVWEHPRQFKEYKQRHPFLLIRLGLCDFKVQGSVNRIMTMPWRHVEEEKKSTGPRIVTDRVEDNPYNHSVLHSKFMSDWPSAEDEAHKSDISTVLAYTYDGYTAGDVLETSEVFADYNTSQGRAKIEGVLRHFEAIGGAYYREFCKAVRLAMER